MFGILGFIKDIFAPAVELIDDLHTSGEEEGDIAIKLKGLEVSLATLQNEVTLKVMEYEGKLLEAKSNIIMAETNSDSWLAKNWRPMTMLVFTGIVVMYWFGYQPENMSPETISDLFDLIKIGLGGYVVGRSVEKAVKVYKS